MRSEKIHPEHKKHKHHHKKKENLVQYVDENNQPRDFPHPPKSRKSYFDEHKESKKKNFINYFPKHILH